MVITMPSRRRDDFQEPIAPLRLVIGADRFALGGALDGIGAHRHASPAVVVGLDRPLGMIAADGNGALQTRVALVAPGFGHAVDVAGGRIAVFMLPPRSREALAPVTALPAAPWLELGHAVLAGDASVLPALATLEARIPRARPLDPRLQRLVGALHAQLDDNVPLAELAGEVGLSEPRVMALARAQLGAPLRYMRRWLRTFAVARAYAAGASLTTAALAAGFASSAHLSSAAREHFGIRPSQVLSPRTRDAIIAYDPGALARGT